MDKSQNQEELIKDTNKLVDKLLSDATKDMKKIFSSDEFLCTSYFIKYMETEDDCYYLKFSNLFKSLNNDKKIIVVSLITNYYQKDEKDKVKIKTKN